MEFSFQPVFCLQSLPRRAYEVGYSVGVGRTFPGSAVPEIASRNTAPKRNAVSQWRTLRKARPGIGGRNGLHFLCRRRYGKCIPESASNAGRGFRLRHDRETISRSRQINRSAISQPPYETKRAARMFVRTAHLARYVEAFSPLRSTKRRCRHWRERSCCTPSWASHR